MQFLLDFWNRPPCTLCSWVTMCHILGIPLLPFGRHQLGLASEDVSRKKKAIEQLEIDFLELRKKAEENQGQLYSSQLRIPINILSTAQLTQSHSREVSDLQLAMAKQEAVIECQKNELESLGEKFDGKTLQLENSNQDCVRMTKELSAIQKRLAESTTMVSLS